MDHKKAAKILRALGNPRRMQIVLHLKKDKALNVSAIAQKLNLSFRSTSRHLHHLENAGLVDRNQSGTSVFYFLSSEIPPEVMGLFARISL